MKKVSRRRESASVQHINRISLHHQRSPPPKRSPKKSSTPTTLKGSKLILPGYAKLQYASNNDKFRGQETINEPASLFLIATTPQEYLDLLKKAPKKITSQTTVNYTDEDLKELINFYEVTRENIEDKENNINQIIDSDIICNLLNYSKTKKNNHFFTDKIVQADSALINDINAVKEAERKKNMLLNNNYRPVNRKRRGRRSNSVNNVVVINNDENSINKVNRNANNILNISSIKNPDYKVIINYRRDAQSKINNPPAFSKSSSDSNFDEIEDIPLGNSNEITGQQNNLLFKNIGDDNNSSDLEHDEIIDSVHNTNPENEKPNLASILILNPSEKSNRNKKVHFFPYEGEDIPPNAQLFDIELARQELKERKIQKNQIEMIHDAIFKHFQGSWGSPNYKSNKGSKIIVSSERKNRRPRSQSPQMNTSKKTTNSANINQPSQSFLTISKNSPTISIRGTGISTNATVKRNRSPIPVNAKTKETLSKNHRYRSPPPKKFSKTEKANSRL